MLGTVGLRLAGVRLLVGWHRSVTNLVAVAQVVGLHERRRQRVAAPVSDAAIRVDENLGHGLDAGKVSGKASTDLNDRV